MDILICGASQIAQELLKRLSDEWRVTVIDKSEKIRGDFTRDFLSVVKMITGDASSPVVLDRARLDSHDYVLALTDDDAVNLAILAYAREKKIINLLGLVHDPSMLPRFHETGAQTVLVTSMMARTIYHYLKDPRIHVSAVGEGEGALLRIRVGEGFSIQGRSPAELDNRDWRIVGMVRSNQLLFPTGNTRIETGDQLIILGKPDVFNAVASQLQWGRPHFPLAYGMTLLLAMPSSVDAPLELFDEALYLAKNTKSHDMTVLCTAADNDISARIEHWSKSLDIRLRQGRSRVVERIVRACNRESTGLVVLPPIEGSRLKSLTRPTLISFAHALPCPVLFSKRSSPYQRILVPFSGTPTTRVALENAVDLAMQMDAEVTAVIVREPDFLHSENLNGAAWIDTLIQIIREMAHIHKTDIHEMVLNGNPVTEIVAAAAAYDLMIVGSTRQDKALFSPHVGELLVQRAPCSVLVVTQ